MGFRTTTYSIIPARMSQVRNMSSRNTGFSLLWKHFSFHTAKYLLVIASYFCYTRCAISNLIFRGKNMEHQTASGNFTSGADRLLPWSDSTWDTQGSTSANEDLEVCSHITENSNCNQNWVDAWKLVFEVYCVCHSEYFGPWIEEPGCHFIP